MNVAPLRTAIAGALLGTLMAGTACGPAAAQNVNQMRAQLQRLQRDVGDLQAQVFRNGTAPSGSGTGAAATASPAATLGPLTQRVSGIEDTMRRLTGQIEVLSHRLDLMDQRLDRMQREVDLASHSAPALSDDTGGQAGPNGVPDETVPNADSGNQVATAPAAPTGLAPPAHPLGTIPAGTPLPQPKTGTAAGATADSGVNGTAVPGPAQTLAQADEADAKEDFDSAMQLLTRAQYDQASQAFRSFADAHPDSDLAPQAVYWTGDIAYSTTKDYEGAARNFAELLKKYPKSPRAPQGMLKLGLSLIALGQKKEGCVTLAALPRQYPNADAGLVRQARAERRKSCR